MSNEKTNKDIDQALKAMLKRVKDGSDDAYPPDVAVKIILAAIQWEKVKNQITGYDDDFRPGDL